jgi:hypothetical protein
MSNFDKLYEAVMSEDDVELGITGAQPGTADVAPAATGEETELTPKEHLAKAIELLQKLQSLDLIPDDVGGEGEAEAEAEAGTESDEDESWSEEDAEEDADSEEEDEEIATEEIEAEDLGHALVNAKKGQELSKVSSGSNKVASTLTSLAKNGKGGDSKVTDKVGTEGERGHALVGSGVKGGAPTSTKGKANVVPGVIKGGGKGDQDLFQAN